MLIGSELCPLMGDFMAAKHCTSSRQEIGFARCQSCIVSWEGLDDVKRAEKCALVLCSSGVLLSPGSAVAEKVCSSTVMVDKADAASRPITPEQQQRLGSAAERQGDEWQIL